MNLRKLILLLALFLATGVGAQIQQQSPYPKREFRGAWIQAVNGQFRGIPTEKLKQTLIDQLNSLQGAGINAIIFHKASGGRCFICFTIGTVEPFPNRSAGAGAFALLGSDAVHD